MLRRHRWQCAVPERYPGVDDLIQSLMVMSLGNGSGLGQDNPDMRLALSQSMSGLTSGQMNHGHTSQHDASHAQSHMMSALGEGGLMNWGGEGDDDGDGDLDASFGMSGVSE